jgi:hypothetical protein
LFGRKTERNLSLQSNQAPRGEVEKPLPKVLCTGRSVTVFPPKSALLIKPLGFDRLFSVRIIVTPSIEVDNISSARILKDRTIPGQSFFINGWEMHVTVIAFSKFDTVQDTVLGPKFSLTEAKTGC